jgi:hypothetical protein
VLAAEHLLDFRALHLLAQRVERLREVGGDVLALPGPVHEHTDIVDLARELIAKLEIVGQAAPALQGFLRLGRVFPEIGGGDALF